jgi:hypothetical protein
LEADAVVGKAEGDTNAYTTGVIGCHNVVLAWMPGMGKGSAASVASSLQFSFQRIKLALIVGICGGVSKSDEEILLGDVIISNGLVQYDFGRQLPNKLKRKRTQNDNLERQNPEIQMYLAKLKGREGWIRLQNNTSVYLKTLRQKFKNAEYPDADNDKLFEPTYRHKHHNSSYTVCTICKEKGDEVCETALNSLCEELKAFVNKWIPTDKPSQSVAAVTRTKAVDAFQIARGTPDPQTKSLRVSEGALSH